MAVKLRLRRLGRKGIAYYHVVAADSRSPRDGKFIEKIGVYDPTRNPAIVEVNEGRAIHWLSNGAQPTDTVRAILKYTGVNLKYALIKQGKDQETIDRIYNKWWEERQARVGSKLSGLDEQKRKEAAENLKRETAIREKREQHIAQKNRPAEEAPAAPQVESVASAEPETAENTDTSAAAPESETT